MIHRSLIFYKNIHYYLTWYTVGLFEYIFFPEMFE